MMTVRQIARLWQSKAYGKILTELMAGRPESSPRLHADLSSLVAAAAIAIIRLDELGQGYVPIYSMLVKSLVAAQDADGGWRDPMTTGLCLRALLTSDGQGLAIERGLGYLAEMQKTEGIWPREPLRRMPADALASAFILLELAREPAFHRAVRFDAAVAWFESHLHGLDAEVRRLWDHAEARARIRPAAWAQRQTLWS